MCILGINIVENVACPNKRCYTHLKNSTVSKWIQWFVLFYRNSFKIRYNKNCTPRITEITFTFIINFWKKSSCTDFLFKVRKILLIIRIKIVYQGSLRLRLRLLSTFAGLWKDILPQPFFKNLEWVENCDILRFHKVKKC